MSMSIRIEGLDDCLKALDRLPENALRMTEASLKEAAQPVAKMMRSKMPQRFRKLIKSKVIKAERRMNGNSTAIIGTFKRRKQSDKEVNDWFKMYWQNYGTLSHRDPGHEFVFPIKKGNRRRRNNVGQDHLNFFEAAAEGWDKMMYNNFIAALKKRDKELLK